MPLAVTLEIWVDGVAHGTRQASGARIVIGRDPGCDVVIDRPGVSPRHLTIESDDRVAQVRAYASERARHNGDELALHRQLLQTGDVLHLGEAQLLVEVLHDHPLPRELPPRRARGGASGDPAGGTSTATERIVAAMVLARSESDVRDVAALLGAEALVILHELAHPLGAAELLSHHLDGPAPTDAEVRSICAGVAAHATLCALLPRLADLAGWSSRAAAAYGHVPDPQRGELATAMLGHPYWHVRVRSTWGMRSAGERGRAMAAVRRSFVESGFVPPEPTRIPVARAPLDLRPDLRLPRLPSTEEARRSGCADLVAFATSGQVPSFPPAPLVLDEDARALVAAEQEASRALSRTLVRAGEPAAE